tara:strand:- start:294 stop:446 length:153 start_codon:yes stop_codon:yes gene_type:complete
VSNKVRVKRRFLKICKKHKKAPKNAYIAKNSSPSKIQKNEGSLSFKNPKK